MNELTIQGKKYISSKKAAEITGYAKDYVGQLAREGYVEATMVGRSWYVLESSIQEHRFGKDEKKDEKKDESVGNSEKETASNENPAASAEESAKGSSWIPAVYHSEPLPVAIPSINLLTNIPSNTPHTLTWVAQQPGSSVIMPQKQAQPVASVFVPPSMPSDPFISMQDAWQEWFSRSTVNQEPLLETEAVIDARNEGETEHVREATTIEAKPEMKYETISEVVKIPTPYEQVVAIEEAPVRAMYGITDEESTVPTINRLYARPTLPVRVIPQNFDRRPIVSVVPVEPQTFIPVRRDTPLSPNSTEFTHTKKGSSLIMSALIVGITAVICSTVFIASELGDKYINASVFKSNTIVSFLEGKTYVKR